MGCPGAFSRPTPLYHSEQLLRCVSPQSPSPGGPKNYCDYHDCPELRSPHIDSGMVQIRTARDSSRSSYFGSSGLSVEDKGRNHAASHPDSQIGIDVRFSEHVRPADYAMAFPGFFMHIIDRGRCPASLFHPARSKQRKRCASTRSAARITPRRHGSGPTRFDHFSQSEHVGSGPHIESHITGAVSSAIYPCNAR